MPPLFYLLTDVLSANYALETIHQIINATPLVNVSFNIPDSPYPMTLPMIGQMGSFTRPSAGEGDVLDLYVHGYVSSRLMNASRSAPPGSNNQASGLPVTICASHVDGLVLTLTPYSHNYNYRSAVLFGHATVVSDAAERLYAMELITNSIVPDRWANTRVPPTSAELQSTSILKVTITTGSAKIRTGQTMPADEKEVDINDDDLLNRVWTGVVPTYTAFGEPLTGPLNKMDKMPKYLGDFLKHSNATARENATDIATKAMKPKLKHDSED